MADRARTAASTDLIPEFSRRVATVVAFRQRSAYANVAWLAQKMLKRTEKRLILPLARVLAEILLVLVFFVLEIIGVGRRLTLAGDVGPVGGHGAVELKPLLQALLGVGQDRVGRAFGLTHAAVDAFVGIDDQHVLALVEAVHGADFDAVHVLALDASLGHDIGHQRLQQRAAAA